MLKRFIFVLVAFSLLVTACGGGGGAGGGETAKDGDADRGKTLYEQTVIGSNAVPGCATCHSREPGKDLVGPSHADVGTRAANAIEGMSDEEYLRESIVNPDAHIAEGFSPSIMYQNYGRDLTGQEVNDLVAYMLTLK